ncbi:hypothetical protein HDC37_000648 [Microbacterium sp. AK009]|uniref:hypothetical protein n=1 Tax=Microbacterium sp. AK009 TaxID=2723068 RepID=UPI0015CA8E3A|nr:hypothetical protein [Microbacterium sp. AK009]NYF15836.1 hypothetical protein [Microbacterium sp. AK009]
MSAPTADPFNGEVLIVTSDVIGQAIEVTAMVPGVSEDTGSCMLEVLGVGTSSAVTGAPSNDVTYCGVMSVPLVSGGGDGWNIRVTYSSPSHRAESTTIMLEAGS